MPEFQPQIKTEHGSVISTAEPLTPAPAEEVAVALPHISKLPKFPFFPCDECQELIRVASSWTAWTCPRCGVVTWLD